MKCKEFTKGLACFDDGAGNLTTLFVHTEYGTNAAGNSIVVATRYTDASDVPFDTSGGTVTPGACAVASPDIEEKTLCDVQADGSVIEFLRVTVTTFDSSNAIASRVSTDYELDGTTAYTPSGTVGKCNEDCDAATAQGVLTTWG